MDSLTSVMSFYKLHGFKIKTLFVNGKFKHLVADFTALQVDVSVANKHIGDIK